MLDNDDDDDGSLRDRDYGRYRFMFHHASDSDLQLGRVDSLVHWRVQR